VLDIFCYLSSYSLGFNDVITVALRKQVKDNEEADDNKRPAVVSPSASDDSTFFNADTTKMEDDDPLFWAPKKLVTEWKNKDGIRCLTIIVQLTGGAANSNTDGVEVKVIQQWRRVCH
jgi:hypothetical protein